VLRRIEDRGSRIEGKTKGRLNPQSSILNPSILRPLLNVTRDEIVAYARARKLKWIEDESNVDGHYDRNYLRHEVLPLIAERFPAYRTTIARASRYFAETARLLDELAENDADVHGGTLELAPLRRLPEARARNALRRYLDIHGVAMPNSMRLDELVRQIRTARTGARIAVDLGNCELRQASGRLHLVVKSAVALSDCAREWHGEAKLALPELGGTLLAKPRRGHGVSRARLDEATVTLRLRRGGERLQLDAQRPHRTLKNLFQEGKVPHWARQGLPLVYCNQELVCVPGIGVDWRYAATHGEPAIEFVWETPRKSS
jgi:tRNA(Ile)-lysidine synthase